MSMGYRPLMRKRFSKATSLMSDQSYLGHINTVNDQLNDELTKLAQKMQMFQGQRSSGSDVQSQLESRRNTLQASMNSRRLLNSVYRTIRSQRDVVSRTGQSKNDADDFKDTLTSHMSKPFGSEGMSSSGDQSQYWAERMPDNEDDIEDYDIEDDAEFSGCAQGPGPTPNSRQDTTQNAALKLNIFKQKKSNSLHQDTTPHQRTFLPKRSRKLSPS